MLQLLIHLYAHYMSILATELYGTKKRIREAYNTYEPLKSLYVRLNVFMDYATAAVEPITKGKVVRISCSLFAETGQFLEYYQTC